LKEERNEGVILWEAKWFGEVTGEGWEILRTDTWRDRCSKGRVDRRICELMNLKTNDLTAG
jgi:hypothetical protein